MELVFHQAKEKYFVFELRYNGYECKVREFETEEDLRTYLIEYAMENEVLFKFNDGKIVYAKINTHTQTLQFPKESGDDNSAAIKRKTLEEYSLNKLIRLATHFMSVTNLDDSPFWIVQVCKGVSLA